MSAVAGGTTLLMMQPAAASPRGWAIIWPAALYVLTDVMANGQLNTDCMPKWARLPEAAPPTSELGVNSEDAVEQHRAGSTSSSNIDLQPTDKESLSDLIREVSCFEPKLPITLLPGLIRHIPLVGGACMLTA